MPFDFPRRNKPYFSSAEPLDDVATLQALIPQCRICRDAPEREKDGPLPHEPRPIAVLSSRARIMIASQAPGLRAHQSGVPFHDASGDRLRDWLDVDETQFYNSDHFTIVPMGFCFPGYDRHGGDLPPRRECAPVWRQKVMAAMPQIELILVIGQYAQGWHLGKDRKANLTQTVRHWGELLFSNRSPAVLPLPHPSWRNSGWLKRNPWFEDELLPVLRERVKFLIR